MSACDYQLKFVVAVPTDLAEVTELVSHLNAPPGKVILMPEGIAASVLEERSPWIAEICKQRGYRFSPRLHIHLYGNRRAV